MVFSALVAYYVVLCPVLVMQWMSVRVWES